MDRYAITRVSGPDQEPVTRAEMKLHLRADDITADDALIDTLIATAREAAENATNRCFVYSQWELRLDAFPDDDRQEILLPRPPAIGINWIRYIDTNGVTQSMNSGAWRLDTQSEPARVWPVYGSSWPTTRDTQNAVTVSYRAGYPVIDSGSPMDVTTNVPAAVKSAIKLIVGHLYANREAVQAGGGAVVEIPFGARYLLQAIKVQDYRLGA